MGHGATPEIVGGLVALMLIAVGILALSNRMRFPFSVALLIGGILLGELASDFPRLFGPLSELEISADLILYVFLPTLVFESAFHLDWRQLRANLAPILILAVPGLIFSAVIIGLVVAGATGISFAAALLLGAILSATDPVAVIALFKRLGAPQRLTVLVEGESLFNDATSIVLARILIGIAATGVITGGDIGNGIANFFAVFIGGILVGWVLAEAASWVLSKVQSDPAIEVTITTVLAYLSFLVAEEGLHVSGVMATVTAGLVYGNRGWMRVSPSVREYLEHFWEYIAFIATALIFLMVGLAANIDALIVQWRELLWLIGGMLISRALVVYGLMPLVNRLPGASAVSRGYQTVMYWGGLRGAIALAIVLSLPDGFAHKENFTVLVMGAVLFTLLVQGVSMDRLVRWLGLDTRPLADRYGEAESEVAAKRHALARLPELSAGGLFSGAIAERLRHRYDRLLATAERDMDILRLRELDGPAEAALVQLRALAEEREHLGEMFNNGHLDPTPFRWLLNRNAELFELMRYGQELPPTRLAHTHTHWLRRLSDSALATVPYLAQKVQLSRVAGRYQIAWATYHLCLDVLAEIAQIVPQASNAEALRQTLVSRYRAWRDEARDYLDQTAEQFPEFVTAMQERHARRLALLAEAETLRQRERRGMLDHGSAERLLHARATDLDRLRGLAAEELRVHPQELLRKVPLFQQVPAEAFAALAKRMRERTFATHESIIVQGESSDSLFLIARGVVRVMVGEGQTQRELATLMAGDFFGEMALLSRAPRTATVRAVTPCTVYELRRGEYEKTAAANPGLAQTVQTIALARQAELGDLNPASPS